jgi:ABC-type sulfate transport system substrate-binding protein
MQYASVGQDHIGSYIVRDVRKNNPENINKWEDITEEANYCMVLLLQQNGLYSLTVAI